MHIENAAGLKAAIEQLEKRKAMQERLLSDHLSMTYESLKPINMLKSTFGEVKSSPELKMNLVNAALGIGVGVISKKIFLQGSTNFFKKIAGTLVELGVASLVAKNSNVIKGAGKGLISHIFAGNKK